MKRERKTIEQKGNIVKTTYEQNFKDDKLEADYYREGKARQAIDDLIKELNKIPDSKLVNANYRRVKITIKLL